MVIHPNKISAYIMENELVLVDVAFRAEKKNNNTADKSWQCIVHMCSSVYLSL